jgi:AbiV family abortive infection protein
MKVRKEASMYWRARRFLKLAELAEDKLFPELEAGLALVGDNAIRLADAAMTLADQGAMRPAKILAFHAEDEAGKFLVLMDSARCPRSHLQEHLKKAAQHLARLIYAETAKLSPATFGELIGYINHYRESNYLDGPGGIEWVYRNSLLYAREEALYVDYVEQEGGTCSWQDPDRLEKLIGSEAVWKPNTFATDLVSAIMNAGLHREAALAAVSSRWRTFEPNETTHVCEVRALLAQTLEDLTQEGILTGDREPWQLVVRQWTFPLWNTDLSEVQVKLSELQGERDRYS